MMTRYVASALQKLVWWGFRHSAILYLEIRNMGISVMVCLRWDGMSNIEWWRVVRGKKYLFES